MHDLDQTLTELEDETEFEDEFEDEEDEEDEFEDEDELEFQGEGEYEYESASILSDQEEMELASELLSATSDEELELFLGKLFKKKAPLGSVTAILLLLHATWSLLTAGIAFFWWKTMTRHAKCWKCLCAVRDFRWRVSPARFKPCAFYALSAINGL